MSGVSWYDVLGVDPDASPAAIKAAWRDATDKFEPGQGSSQFRMFNDAADVLLDPVRRTAYDEEIGVAAKTSVAAGAVAAPSGSATSAPPSTSLSTGLADDSVTLRKTTTVPQATTTTIATTTAITTATAAALPVVHHVPQSGRQRSRRPRPARAGRGVPVWVLAVLGVLTVAALVVGATFALNNHDESESETAGDQASAAAERALPVILSYDYRHLRADRDQAVRFMTPRYQREYTATFDKLITSSDSEPGPAVQTKAVVKATVEDVGVVSAESSRARVIVFLNQTTVKGSANPQLALNRLTATMVKSGNAWLVENIVSY